MKIALIVRRLNVAGGIQRLAIELARFLEQRGHNIVFYTFVYDQSLCFESLSHFKVVTLPEDRKIRFFKYIPFFGPIIKEGLESKRLAGLIDKDTELLNPHGEASYKVAYYFKQRKKISSVWMMNDMITKQVSFERAQANDQTLRLTFWKKMIYKVFDWIEIKKYVSCQDAIVVHNKREAAWAKKYFGRPAAVVPGGLNSDDFPFVSHKPPTGKISLVTMGILFPHRRYEDTIKTLSALSKRGFDVRLYIIGAFRSSDRYFKKLKIIIESLGLSDRVEFLGALSQNAVLSIYAYSDIFVFVSHMQSWGLAVFEALASGLPVVVSKTAGASEILTDHKNALIVEPKNPRALAAAVQELIEDSELYKKLALNGNDFVRHSVSWEKFGSQLEDIFLQTRDQKL